MDRREWMGALGAGAIGLTALTAGAADTSDDDCCHLDKTHEDCLKACADCAKACDMTFNHCYNKVADGKTEHARSMRLAADCAAFCGLSACNIAKMSPLMVYSCMACAEACKTTLAEVGKFDSDEMKAAAKKLQECEKSCRAMVAEMKTSSAPRAN